MAQGPASLGSIVVDANVLFGALLRDSTNRNLMLHGDLDLHAPEWLWDELERNREFLVKKSHAANAAFDLLIEGLRDRIRSIPLPTIQPHMLTALKRVGAEHELDAPYVAAAIAINGTVWSHDKALAETAGIPVVTTRDLLTFLDQ